MSMLNTESFTKMFKEDPFYTPLTMPKATVKGFVQVSNITVGGGANITFGEGCTVSNTRLAGCLTIGNEVSIRCLLLTNSTVGDGCLLKTNCFVQNANLGRDVTVGYDAKVVNCTINSGVTIGASACIANASNVSKVCTLQGGSWKTNESSVLTAYNCSEGVMFFIPGLPRHKHYEKSYTYDQMVKIAEKYLPTHTQLINDLDTLTSALKNETPILHNGWGNGQLKIKN